MVNYSIKDLKAVLKELEEHLAFCYATWWSLDEAASAFKNKLSGEVIDQMSEWMKSTIEQVDMYGKSLTTVRELVQQECTTLEKFHEQSLELFRFRNR